MVKIYCDSNYGEASYTTIGINRHQNIFAANGFYFLNSILVIFEKRNKNICIADYFHILLPQAFFLNSV